MAAKDYFSFETIRDNEKNVICYYITVIGTIEQDGTAHMRTDLSASGEGRMAFGRVTVRNLDRKIGLLLKETNTRVYYHSYDENLGTTDVISYTAKDWRADEAYTFEPGDRVLIQGRAYIRKADPVKYPGRLPELSVTVSGMFKLGRARSSFHRGMNASLIPQK